MRKRLFVDVSYSFFFFFFFFFGGGVYFCIWDFLNCNKTKQIQINYATLKINNKLATSLSLSR